MRTSRVIYSSTCAATDGPDKPGHDDSGTFLAIGQASDFAVVSEMCEPDRDKPGHDDPGGRPPLRNVPTCLRLAVAAHLPESPATVGRFRGRDATHDRLLLSIIPGDSRFAACKPKGPAMPRRICIRT